MKKTSSSKSLINLARRYSINLGHQTKQQKLLKTNASVHQKSKTNLNSNVKIITNVNSLKPYDKKDIKQIFQYKIKQKSFKQNTKKPIQDSKKQMLRMINERDNRLKTQAALKSQQINAEPIIQTQNPKQTSITMNLNVSFVKLRSPHKISNKQSSKNLTNKLSINKMSYSSSYSKLNSKQKKSKEKCIQDKEINDKQKKDVNLENIFDQYLHKDQISRQDFESFLQLNKKIFTQFKKIMDYSLITYQHMRSKTQQAKQTQAKYEKIQKFYKKINIIKEKCDYPPRIIKIKTQPCYQQQQLCQSLQNSQVSSYKVNPQKSYQTYRLKKLNESLGLLAGMSIKKPTQIQSSTSPKVFFSKPVSTNISRKISFNNSFNNSLKNSKIQ